MLQQHTDEDEDDGFVAPVAVHVEGRVEICPACSRPLAKHSLAELLRCAEHEDQAQQEEDDAPPPSPVVVERPPPVPAVVEEEPEQPKIIALPSGELDYEQLAAAMRAVIERERDEVIKRGGPLEKQNAELKERLAQALDDAGMWRRRQQMTAAQRNTLQEQLDDQIKANRKLRNELKGRKENNHTRVLDINDILDVVQKTSGFTVERAGNGHFIIKKHGVFVTDAASSGQGTKVNMATRVALRKAGLDV